MKVFRSYINVCKFKCFVPSGYNQGTASLLFPEDMTIDMFIGSMDNSRE